MPGVRVEEARLKPRAGWPGRDCFRRLAALLNERDITGEIAIVGGAAMMLAFHAREATKDVDAIFAPGKEIRDAVRQIALETELPPDWLLGGQETKKTY